MRQIFLIMMFSIALVGCQDTVSQNANNLDRPEHMTVVCTKTLSCIAPLEIMEDCSGEDVGRHCGFVTNGAHGDLAILDLSAGTALDTDPFIPGFTRRNLEGQPGNLTAVPSEDALFIVNKEAGGLGPRIDRLSLTHYLDEATFQALPASGGPLLWIPGETTQVLAVGIPEQKTLVLIRPESFGEVASDALDQIPLNGRPSDLALSPDASILYVAFENIAHVSAYDTETFSILWNASIAPTCVDGFDNDGDGLVDGEDLGCSDGDLWSETEPTPSACNDGVDNDGDGLVDYPEDPGCYRSNDISEGTDSPPCTDGVDNDGDGLVDADDPECSLGSGLRESYACSDGIDNDGNGLVDLEDSQGCSSPVDGVESKQLGPCEDSLDNDGNGLVDADDPTCFASNAQGENAPACSNGIDDDGDSLLDADDPDCFTRAGATEVGSMDGVQARISVSKDGRFLYATNRSLAQVFVIHTEKGALVDVNNRPEGLGQPFLRAENIRGIPFSAAPLAIEFAETKVQVGDELLSAQTAFIATNDGQLYFIDAMVGDEETHLLRPVTYTNSSVSTPTLAIAGETIEQTFSARSDYANIGLFGIVLDTLTYHGITLFGESLTERSETWTLTHQGRIPSTESEYGTIFQTSIAEELMVFHDPFAEYCAQGVEPGDYLTFHMKERLFCGGNGTSSPPFQGDRFEYPILEVRPDSLVVDRNGGIALLDWTEEERTLLGKIDVEESASFATQAPLADVSCLEGAHSTSIRVASGTYTVVGSLSGYLHPWETIDGACVRKPADSQEMGRAYESVPNEGLTLLECTQPLADAVFATETVFSNYGFSLRVRPGCETKEIYPESSEDEANPLPEVVYEISETPRELSLTFSLISGYQPRRLVVAHIPTQLLINDVLDSIFIVDSGLNRVLQLNQTTLQQGFILD